MEEYEAADVTLIIKAGSQYDTQHKAITIKHWNRLDFYSSVTSWTSKQLTWADMFLFVQRNYFYRQKR